MSDATGAVNAAYDEAERHASRFRRLHMIVTSIAVVLGTVALIIALAGLSFPPLPSPPHGPPTTIPEAPAADGIWPTTEFALALGSAFLVALGIATRLQKRWLLYRYKAERYRSLRFNVTIQPAVWIAEKPSTNPAEHLTRKELDEVELLGLDDLTAIAESEEPLVIPDPAECAKVDPACLPPLIADYLKNRLNPQIEYLGKLSKRQENLWLPGSSLAPFAFFVSVVFVVLHYVAESRWFLFLSAALPVVWAGYRTWRSANEQERNASRSKAKLAVLLARAATLDRCADEADPSKSPAVTRRPDPFLVFSTLAMAENLLRNELQEWLRLMLPTEWFS